MQSSSLQTFQTKSKLSISKFRDSIMCCHQVASILRYRKPHQKGAVWPGDGFMMFYLLYQCLGCLKTDDHIGKILTTPLKPKTSPMFHQLGDHTKGVQCVWPPAKAKMTDVGKRSPWELTSNQKMKRFQDMQRKTSAIPPTIRDCTNKTWQLNFLFLWT